MPNRRTALAELCAAIGAAVFPEAVLAQPQGWPDRPLRLIVPVPPGGLADILARSLALRLGETLGQTVIVENKPGAGSLIGTDYVLKQPADGYTMLLTWTAIVQNPLLLPNAHYDPVKDFAPVARLGGISAVFAVGSHVNASNLKEFIALAKGPQAITYGVPGIGSAAHFYGEIMSRTLGLNMSHVPYKGDAEMVPDLLNQRVDAAFVQALSVDQHAKQGKVKVLAVTGPKRINLMPSVPTFQEQGVPGLDDDRWFGIFMRAGTPQPIVDRISAETEKWVALPATQERMRTAAMDPGAMNAADFTAAVAKSQQQWRDIVKRVPIKLN